MHIVENADELRAYLSTHLRSGDGIVVPQAAGEPFPLAEALLDVGIVVPDLQCFVGLMLSTHWTSVTELPFGVDCVGALGATRKLVGSGQAIVKPVQLHQIPGLLRSGDIASDVVFIQVTPRDSNGNHSLGVTADYVHAAMERARLVVAEINSAMPWTHGDTLVDSRSIDCAIETSRELPTVPAAHATEIDVQIGRHVAGLVEDRAVLQIGIGAVPEAILKNLTHVKDLGIHSGLIGDGLMNLVRQGVVTNRYKPIDPGKSVTGVLMGSHELYAWAEGNDELSLRSANHTHSVRILSQLPTLTTVNSAVEVDLTGQVNAEMAGNRYVGAVGGQVDFVRAGTLAEDGKSIIALTSRTGNGQSKIVPRISSATVTSLRTDVEYVVTEYGAARLLGCNLEERTRRMISIAHPDDRDSLEREAQGLW